MACYFKVELVVEFVKLTGFMVKYYAHIMASGITENNCTWMDAL